MVAVTAVWCFVLLDRVPAWHPWLRVLVLVGGLATAFVVALRGGSLRGRAVGPLAVCCVALALAAPAAYTLSTLSTAQGGQNVSAGPAVAVAGSFGQRGLRPGAPTSQSHVSSTLVSLITRDSSRYTWVAATSDWQTAASIELAGGGKAVMAIGGFSGVDNMTLARFESLVTAGEIHYYVSGGGPGGGAGEGPGGLGGLAGLRPPGPPPGAQGPGGFPGPGGGPGGPGGHRSARQISSWVASHYRAVTVGGTTIYDLTQPKSGA
jgi:hypothetical protein